MRKVSKEDLTKKRLSLRVPTKIPAKLFLEDSPHKNIYISDLSIGGVSFFIKEEDFSLDVFELEFKLAIFLKAMRIKVAVKNKTKTPQGLRIGCAFLHPKESEKNLISDYICKFINFYAIFNTLGLASFLCLIDGLWRVSAYFIELIYEVTKYNTSAYEFILKDPYLFFLIVYISSSALAFIFTSIPKTLKEEKRIFVGIAFLSISFLFLLFKNINYWKMDLSLFSLEFLTLLLGAEFFLLLFLGFSIFIGLVSKKRVELILSSIDTHYSFLYK